MKEEKNALTQLVELGVAKSRLEKYTDSELETMLAIETGNKNYFAYNGERCKCCGLVWRRRFAWEGCPRCQNQK